MGYGGYRITMMGIIRAWSYKPDKNYVGYRILES
jgi:hypothetical protein